MIGLFADDHHSFDHCKAYGIVPADDSRPDDRAVAGHAVRGRRPLWYQAATDCQRLRLNDRARARSP